MSSARFTFLGLPSVELETATVPLGANRPMQLLAHLAVTGEWQGRDHVAHLFWPERTNKIARSNLRNLLFKLQDAAPFALIESTEQLLRLKAPSDLNDFDAAVRLRDWEAAVRIGAAELLQGFDNAATEPYLLWLQSEREARLGQWTKAVQALLAESSRPLEDREALAQSWALRCRFDEDAVQARLSLAHERDQAAAAARIYRAFEARLRDELGVRPSVDLERFALQAPGRSSSSAPEPATPDRAAATPAARASAASRPPMIGRRHELRQLAALLKEDATQLVTLTGPGGVGKSAVLAAFHQLWVDGGGAGAFLVDVSGAPSARAAIAAIARALGVTVPQGVPEEEALADALGERRWLLMIDGAEQAGINTPLALLLERCPQTRWLVASRQRLHLDNEHLLVLDGFPLPDTEEADPELLGANDGVRFLEDAITKSGQPVDMAREATDMAAIVRAVDGLPLALKLLGKLTHLFSLRQLLDSLRQQPGSGTGPVGALEIQELLPSLVASFQRSWMSLSPTEQTVLARLAVFPAEFEITAGRWVARTELPLVMSLVDRSLVRATGAGRLSLHAAIRSCVQAMSPQPAADAAVDYVAYYTQRLRGLASLARSRTVRPLKLYLQTDAVHARHAWALALERRDHAALLSLQESVWFMDDGTSAAVDFNERCIEAERVMRDDPALPPALRALLFAGMAQDFLYQMQWAPAMEHARRALREAQRARHYEASISALFTLCWAHAYQGNNKQAEALLLRAQTLLASASAGDGLLAMGASACRAMLAIEERDLDAALEHYERAATLARQFETPDAELICLSCMAGAYHAFGVPERAIAFEDRALALGAEGKADRALVATYLCGLTEWNIDCGNVERARTHMERVDALVSGYPQVRMLRLRVSLGHAAVCTAQGNLAVARTHLSELLAAVSSGDTPGVSTGTFVATARWFRSAGERQACVQALRAVLINSGSGENFKLAKAMLRELGEEPAEEVPPEIRNSQTCTAAALARQKMMQLVLSTRSDAGALRPELEPVGARPGANHQARWSDKV